MAVLRTSADYGGGPLRSAVGIEGAPEPARSPVTERHFRIYSTTSSMRPPVDLEQQLTGHDPLESIEKANFSMTEDATKRQVVNILKCYTHYYDVFSEAIQNALDAVEASTRQQDSGHYTGRIWITIDIPNRRVRVVDNGVGMNVDQFKYCFRPNVSFKAAGEYRGQKGVGATFLAYGFSFVQLQSKQKSQMISAILRGGRQWVNDSTGRLPRPRFEVTEWNVPELDHEGSGTCVDITIGKEAGERPSDLLWLGAQTADQWLDVLRIKTPLGQVFLTGSSRFAPAVNLEVVSPSGQRFTRAECKSEYYYPHEIPGVRGAELGDLTSALAKIDGDAQTKFRKLSDDLKRLHCLYRVWAPNDVLDTNQGLNAGDKLTEDEAALCSLHDVTVYGALVNSLDVWDNFSDDVLKLRRKQRLLRGGLQMASDNMVQGELIPIPLRRTVGYQHQTHVIVHFKNGNPDLGRKVFQPEYQQLAEKLSVAVVNLLVRYRSHLRPDTGAAQMVPDRELQEWIENQKQWRRSNALKIHGAFPNLSVLSEPREEQDVIGLFHELIGCGILRGYNFLAATFNERYDGLFELEYTNDDVYFEENKVPLGVSRDLDLPFHSAVSVIEYKFDLDGLARDFSTQTKFANHVSLAVCWQASPENQSKFELHSLLTRRAGETRKHFGATHAAYIVGHEERAFEVIVLQDLVSFLADPQLEAAKQEARFGSAL
jgi:hypothetical protein